MYILPEKNTLYNLVKKPMDLDGQIEQLRKRGLSVPDDTYAKSVLLSTNYYYFTGYLHPYKKIRTNSSGETEEYYDTSLNFDDIYEIIKFDFKMRSIIMLASDYSERNLKTRISYHMSANYSHGNVAYLYSDNFKKYEHNKFMSYFVSEVEKKNKNEFVKHHKNKYWGCLPIWAAVEVMTTGNLEYFYKMLDYTTKDVIATEYSMKVENLEDHITFSRLIRNTVAHNSRLFHAKISAPPATRLPISLVGDNLFNYIVVLKELFTDSRLWNTEILEEIKQLINRNMIKVPLDCWGFPSDWENRLTM
ncbi:Abi family protein [Proteiniclasticum ruminis]|uniref:Abi family protein n=1 Tax=Proteiniclasticum ruminis TaxID=398199 RepID=UPI0028AA1D36|nr:Abi family protein [Proteiniclasticum ruminis]